VHHQNVFGGNRAVRLELEQPVALGVLRAYERVARGRDAAIKQLGVLVPDEIVGQDFRARRLRL
jgi:hypothetical protein